MLETILGIVFGGLITVAVAAAIENFKRPRLRLKLSPPADFKYEDERPAAKVRHLHVVLIHDALPRLARWMSRNTATLCSGSITFHHLDGQNVFGRSMPIRWSNTPQPVPSLIMHSGKVWGLLAPQTVIDSIIDIPPGESRLLDVAARFDDESECYGWSNLNYFSTPLWRNPEWRLPSGRYLVRITVTSSGERCSAVFRLINDVAQQDFRLELPQPNDRVS